MTRAGRLVISAAIAAVMVGVEFFVISHADIPLPSFVRIGLAFMNLIPVAVALRVAGGSSGGPNLIVVGIVGFLQWFVIVFLISLVFRRRG